MQKQQNFPGRIISMAFDFRIPVKIDIADHHPNFAHVKYLENLDIDWWSLSSCMSSATTILATILNL